MAEETVATSEAAAPVADIPAVVAVEPEAAAPAPPATESLIESATAEPPVVEATEAAPAAEAGAAPAEEPKSAAPAIEAAPEPIAYTEFTIPEGLTVPEERMSEFTALASESRLPQETAQKYLDLHASVVRQAQEAMDQRQRDVFDETRAGWRKDVDRRFGNRRDTVVNDAKWAIEQLIPDAKARAEVWDTFSFTGVGDHPAVINLLARAAVRLRERAAPPQGLSARPGPTNPADKRYGAPRT